MTTSVDISHLYACNPNQMNGLKQEELAEALKGSDLQLDESTGRLIVGDQAKRTRTVAQQVNMMQQLMEAAGEDKKIDLEEAKRLIVKMKMEGTRPTDFLADAQRFIDKRWKPICKNLKGYSAEYPFLALYDALETYNDGFYKEESDQARRSFSPIKSVANIGSIFRWGAQGVGYNPDPIMEWDPVLKKFKEMESYAFIGDNYSQEDAFADHGKRWAAIEALKKVVAEDISTKADKGFAWNALPNSNDGEKKQTTAQEVLEVLKQSGDITVTVHGKEQTILGAEAAELLEQNLAFKQLYDITTTPDKKERLKKAMDFAKLERAGFMGFGTGNTGNFESLDWDNMSGGINNHYYARSVFSHIIRKSPDPEMKAQANKILGEMRGDGGTFSQWIVAGTTNVAFPVFNILPGVDLEPAPFRSMSDEDAVNAPERAVRFGLLAAVSFKGIQLGKHWVPKGTQWLGGRVKAWETAEKLTAIQRASLMAYKGARGIRHYSYGWAFDRFSAWLQKGMEAAPVLQGAAKAGGKGWDLFMAGAMAYFVDEWMAPPVDYYYDRKMNLDPLPKQDPVLSSFQSGGLQTPKK